MKRAIILSFCFIVAGCESVPITPVTTQEVMQKRFISLSQLRTGLTRPEVENLLGKEVVVGYDLVEDDVSGQYKPITVINPQRSENIRVNNKTYNVSYYFVGIKAADDKITDDELVPLVFYNDRLVGVGRDFLNKHVKDQ